jgi:RNA polymerase sigma-70 factor (ECF subfamily)
MREELDSESDINLWERVSRDDEAAFKVLFQRYWQLLFTNVFYYLKDRDACSDIVHDIFISIWKRRQQLEIFSFRHYLTNAARYKVYKYLKTAGKNKMELTDNIEHNAGFTMNVAENKFTNDALEQRLDKHLNELPQRCREIFLLSRKGFLTNDEIARKLKISKRTVENQLTFALRQLRFALNDILLTVAILPFIYNCLL